MADNIRGDLLDQFINITGVDSDRARFYLESSAWNLELAMASFYEGDGNEDDSAPVQAQDQDWPRSSTQSSRFATISNMKDDESSSSDEEGQAFYAGGSETSGQQILGPKKNKNLVENLFKSARAHGAEEVNAGDTGQAKAAKPTFRGTGYRLGETEESAESDVIRGSPLEAGPHRVDVVLKLWKTGFSVDSGPLRDYKDPANQEFLSSIQRGEIPKELIRSAKGGEVNLNMEDHKDEEFVKPKVSLQAFSGAGHMLGSPVPTVVTADSKKVSNPSGSKQNISVDSSQPTTSLQIRLADGSRLVAKFNHSHCIEDIRRFITVSRPQYESTNFSLMTTFPNKELENERQSIEEAKLLNAVIVQKLK